MFKSPTLDLSYLAPSQAQKHVTVNETVRRLDAIVQLSVVSATQLAEPTSPNDGDVYILPTGKTGTVWSAMADSALAAFQDGAWTEIAPQTGWRAFVTDENTLSIFNGSWAPLSGGGSTGGEANISTNSGSGVGIAKAKQGVSLPFKSLVAGTNVSISQTQDEITIASSGGGGTGVTDHSALTNLTSDDHPQYLNQARGDARYPLLSNIGVSPNDLVQLDPSGRLPAIDGSLLTNLSVSGSNQESAPKFGINATADEINKLSVNSSAILFNNDGGGIQTKINKAGETDTASYLFQTGFSGRAEMGLTGSDNFHFKVSSDGSTFTDAIILDKDTGRASMPHTPTFLIMQSGRFYLYTDLRWVTSSDDVFGYVVSNNNESGGNGADPIIEWEHLGQYLPKGARIKNIHFILRSSVSEITDLELYLFSKHPTDINDWKNGIISDTQVTSTEIYRDLFLKPVNGEPIMPGVNTIAMRKRSISTDYVMPEDGMVSLFLRPVGVPTTTRYAFLQFALECTMG